MRFFVKSIVSVFCCLSIAFAQSPTARVGFYNVQNLYDTINDPSVDDGEFSDSKTNKFDRKISELSRAIESFSPDILGLCEVENYSVVESLTSELDRHYSIVHYDSRDSRGIDVAMIYDTTKFEVIESELVKVDYLWRDFLRVGMKTKLSGEDFVLYVVHLPSKLGGKRAENLRAKAHKTLDSLVRVENTLRVVVCGDMNDDPISQPLLYNCALRPWEAGVANYAYRDVWNMPDQIMITPELQRYLETDQKVVREAWLLTPSGRFEGYPRRYRPSDHLPIYIDIKL